jgi:hypothetical protein
MSAEAPCLDIDFKPGEKPFSLIAFKVESPRLSVKAEFIGNHVLFKSSPEAVASGSLTEGELSLKALLKLSKNEAFLDSTSGDKKNIGPLSFKFR